MLRLRFRAYGANTGRGFCTPVHRFSQLFDQNLIDGVNGKHYLARHIEPGSFRTLRINLEGAASFTAGCAARLNREARSLNSFLWMAGLASRRSRRQAGSGREETLRFR